MLDALVGIGLFLVTSSFCLSYLAFYMHALAVTNKRNVDLTHAISDIQCLQHAKPTQFNQPEIQPYSDQLSTATIKVGSETFVVLVKTK